MEIGPGVNLTFDAEVLKPYTDKECEPIIKNLEFAVTYGISIEITEDDSEFLSRLLATLKDYQRLRRKEAETP